jgi:anaerobic ribonucleoside-triphosphate reductase activating protein
VAVWTQGCSIKCKGCFNPELWGERGGELVSTTELTRRILVEVSNNPGTEGVTFLGGEPFDQASELAELAHDLRSAGLSIMVFTGFTLEELRDSTCSANSAFLDAIDLLVDGKFEESNLDPRRPWLGSTNQRFHFLTNRYSALDVQTRDFLEVTVKSNGELEINGWAESADIEQLVEMLDLDSSPKRRNP